MCGGRGRGRVTREGRWLAWDSAAPHLPTPPAPTTELPHVRSVCLPCWVLSWGTDHLHP